METFHLHFIKIEGAVTCEIRKDGRASPVYVATRPTKERAWAAALVGAGFESPSGSRFATFKGRVVEILNHASGPAQTPARRAQGTGPGDLPESPADRADRGVR